MVKQGLDTETTLAAFGLVKKVPCVSLCNYCMILALTCVSIQGLHPLEEYLKVNYITTPRGGCPNLKAPPDAAHKCSFFSLFLEDAPLLSFMASHIPGFFARP